MQRCSTLRVASLSRAFESGAPGGAARANRAALLAERSQDGESEGSIERAEGTMPGVSVRRDGTGSPELRET